MRGVGGVGLWEVGVEMKGGGCRMMIVDVESIL